ncbi:MAG: hypothetical protein IJS60_00910 [Abditibacteriota bacterium]|nr:hypothetical protein [Abditibacteriota bacterium]
MKKLYLLLIIIVIGTMGCNAQSKDYIIKNKDITVGIFISDDYNATISKIADNGTRVNFITDTDENNNLWSFICKPSNQFTADSMFLGPRDAEKLTVTPLVADGKIDSSKPLSEQKFKDAKSRTPDALKMVWENVKIYGMNSGFDVTVYCALAENNSYWNIGISSNQDYGVWQIIFPNITNIDVAKGNNVLLPQYGGNFSDGFDTNMDLEYPGVVCSNQLTSVTKGGTSLYMSPEDVKAEHKIFSFKTPKPDNMNFYITLNPDYMGVGGKEYVQSYNFNFATLKGDWFDVAKKFRAWGIKSNFAPFSQGKIEDRADLPQWFKDCPMWLTQHGLTDETKANVIKTKEFLGVPVAVHTYHWSQYLFDTHYPNWLPAQDRYKQDIMDFQAKDIKVMPYTNTHLVDINQAPTYKKYGDILLSFGPDEKPRISEFQAEGANNVTCCPTSPYYDAYLEEVQNIMKEENIDALYMDQVGCVPAFTCFNKDHNHPVGGGSHWADTYYKLIQEIREKLNEIKGEPIVITTESSAEAYPFDAWLRCNELNDSLADSPVNTVIYSGYVASFGNYYYGEEFTRQEALPAINKTAIVLTKGWQPGWGFGTGDEVHAYPYFGKYVKGVAEARWAGKEYFNFGEMVRNVTITSSVPKDKIFLQNFGILGDYDFPVVRTCSFNYKGKTMVCLTNIQINDSIKVDFEATPSDLYLKEKSSYTISEIYPQKAETAKGKAIKAKTELAPLETKIFIVE